MLTLLLLSLPLTGAVQAASEEVPGPAQTSSDASTSDYLSTSMRLLFPSAPASLDLGDVQAPFFNGDTPGYDLLSLGVLPDPEALTSSVLTKTISLQLGGGFRGRVFAAPPWLSPLPDRFINPNQAGQLQIAITARQDAGQGAGLLPAQTNWGHLLLSLNGVLFDYAVPLIVGNPASVGRDKGDTVFGLYGQVKAQLDRESDLDAFIGTPTYPNSGQLALGLIVDYLGVDEYNHRLSEADFINRVAETLAQKDYNADGWIGFKPEDIVLGAPGWALGQQVK